MGVLVPALCGLGKRQEDSDNLHGAHLASLANAVSRAAYSVAVTGDVAQAARRHLLRTDGQEDLCFALWHPSRGRSRMTALIYRLILPRAGDRHVHKNASFDPVFFERALSEAAADRAGLALMHSHPRGIGWQGMSLDDVKA